MEAAKESKCVFHSSCKPTYCLGDTDKTPDLLNFFISKNMSANFINVDWEYYLDSDHLPLILTLRDKIICFLEGPTGIVLDILDIQLKVLHQQQKKSSKN